MSVRIRRSVKQQSRNKFFFLHSTFLTTNSDLCIRLVEYATGSNWLQNNRLQNDYNDALGQLSVQPSSSHSENPQSSLLDCAVGQTYATHSSDSMSSAVAGSSLMPSCREIESGTKRITSMANVDNKDCEYLKLVAGFKRTLVLPDIFFSFDAPACYCLQCSSIDEWNTLEGMCQALIRLLWSIIPQNWKNNLLIN